MHHSTKVVYLERAFLKTEQHASQSDKFLKAGHDAPQSSTTIVCPKVSQLKKMSSEVDFRLLAT